MCAFGAASLAQIPPIQSTPSPTPAPSYPTPKPSPKPRPSPTETPAEEQPADEPTPAPEQPAPAPPITGPVAPSAEPSPPVKTDPKVDKGGLKPGGLDVPGRVIPPGVTVPVIPRTPGRSTAKLLQVLERVESVGVPRDAAMAEGMGRLPIGGLTYWSDDWWAPRFTPFFHLHQGLDLFAEFGTPIRSPDRGVISRLSEGPVGGIGAWVTGRDGTQYYFAHMQAYANGVSEGMQVDVGTVIGFVGDTGNARGGAPHLHFEVHKPGAVPPKPYVDQWLADAEKNASAWVEARIREVLAERQLLRSEHTLAGLLRADTMTPQATPEYSLLLTLIDPVAGSVGLLPRLPIAPRAAAPGSSTLMEELIKLRVDGSILTSFVTGANPRADAGL
jgi:murein DD-endopeptidase MepM/ murein hydrolase activator NlpD